MLEIIGNILCAMLAFAGLGTIIAALDRPAASTADDPDIAAPPRAGGAVPARFLLGLAMIAAGAYFADQLRDQGDGARKLMGATNERQNASATPELDELIEQERERRKRLGQ